MSTWCKMDTPSQVHTHGNSPFIWSQQYWRFVHTTPSFEIDALVATTAKWPECTVKCGHCLWCVAMHQLSRSVAQNTASAMAAYLIARRTHALKAKNSTQTQSGACKIAPQVHPLCDPQNFRKTQESTLRCAPPPRKAPTRAQAQPKGRTQARKALLHRLQQADPPAPGDQHTCAAERTQAEKDPHKRLRTAQEAPHANALLKFAASPDSPAPKIRARPR